MQKSFRFLALAAVIVAPCMLSAAGFAQQTQPASPSSTTTAPPTMPQGDNANASGERAERRELREERMQIRAEHEALQAEHDKLKAECMQGQGQTPYPSQSSPPLQHAPMSADCKQRMQDLHARHEALHERMKALHEKMVALNPNMAKKPTWKDQGGSWMNHPNEAPSGAPGGVPDSGNPGSSVPSAPPAQ